MNYVMTLPLLDRMRPGDPKPQAYLDAWAEGAAYCREQQDLARTSLRLGSPWTERASARGSDLRRFEPRLMEPLPIAGG